MGSESPRRDIGFATLEPFAGVGASRLLECRKFASERLVLIGTHNHRKRLAGSFNEKLLPSELRLLEEFRKTGPGFADTEDVRFRHSNLLVRGWQSNTMCTQCQQSRFDNHDLTKCAPCLLRTW